MENLMLKGLQGLFDQLQTGQREALKHKESTAELVKENAELKRRLWEYENCYRIGKLTTSGD